MAPKKIFIIGSGSQARYVIDIFQETKQFEIAGIVDVESSSRVGQNVNGVKILHALSDFPSRVNPAQAQLILAYGKNEIKNEIATSMKGRGFSFISAISPHAYVSPHAKIGVGCIINPHATVMANAQVGDHVILHSQCVVEHDNVIGDFANLAPGVTLAGRVTIGQGATLYTGVRVIPDIQIEQWAVVAAGSLVTKNVSASARVGGVPARALPSSDSP